MDPNCCDEHCVNDRYREGLGALRLVKCYQPETRGGEQLTKQYLLTSSSYEDEAMLPVVDTPGMLREEGLVVEFAGAGVAAAGAAVEAAGAGVGAGAGAGAFLGAGAGAGAGAEAAGVVRVG